MEQARHFLLLQVRSDDDPMRPQEVAVFQRRLGCDDGQLAVHNLLTGPPTAQALAQADVVLLGGAGAFSVSSGGPWLNGALEAMRQVYELGKPTFGACMGFHLMAQALGGRVVQDDDRAELGIVSAKMTEAGKADWLFGGAGESLMVLNGHHDVLEQLPPEAVLLATTEKAPQAFTVKDRPMYFTQFHPELAAKDFLERVRAYPDYVEEIAGVPYEEFVTRVVDTPEATALLTRFAREVPLREVAR